MLAPETWAFDPPASVLHLSEDTLDSSQKIGSLIRSHHFNHLVSVVLPDTPQVPQTILDTLSVDSEYYEIKNVSAEEFIKEDFIDAFVKQGHLTILSVGTRVDLNNCLAVTNSGHLVLSLDRESYQELGLEGKPIRSKQKDPQRYIVTLDLTAGHFRQGKKNYERAYSCLRDCLQTFDVVLSWEPHDDKVCPSSVASYLCGQGLQVEVCQPKFKQRRDFNVSVPSLGLANEDSDVEVMLEWLGMFCLDVASDSSEEGEFLNSYCYPNDTIECGQVAFLCWEGFFTPLQIINLFNSLSEYFKDRDDIPWVSLYVQGFADMPIGWESKPHTFNTDGDCSYSIIFKPKNDVILASLHSNTKMLK